VFRSDTSLEEGDSFAHISVVVTLKQELVLTLRLLILRHRVLVEDGFE